MKEHSYKPARKVVTRSPYRIVGFHAGKKVFPPQPWESRIEKAQLERLEVDPFVLSFAAQPKTFRWHGLKYTPDVFVETVHGSFFIEVKPDKVLEDDDKMARLREVASRLAHDGVQLRLVLRKDLFKEPLRQNVVSLMREIRRPIEESSLQSIRSAIDCGASTLSELQERLGAGEKSLVRACIAQGHLLVDIEREISGETIIYKRQEK